VKTVSREQMRELEARTIADFGVPGSVLMDRAGLGVAETVHRLSSLRSTGKAPVLVCAGKGNNGGDAFVTARYLHGWGYQVSVAMTARAASLSGDAKDHWTRMFKAGVPFLELPEERNWNGQLTSPSANPPVVVDGILGTGIQGPPTGVPLAAIRHVNAMRQKSPVVAIDVPSGLNADTGRAEGETVRADITVTMGLPKKGFTEPDAIEYMGTLEVVDIGIPDSLLSTVSSDMQVVTAAGCASLLPQRARASHKGDFGHVLVVGGAAGFAGAPALAAMAALRSGAGLVSALVPRSIAGIVAGFAPEVMVHPGLETSSGSLSAEALAGRKHPLGDFTAIVAGPGLTRHPDSLAVVEYILRETRCVLVLDADALNALAGRIDRALQACRPERVILTPHPGEMARLLGCTAANVQAGRRAAALQCTERTGAVTVLKGAGTLIAASGRPLEINLTGNPGLATAATGDVLAGLIGGLAAQGLKPEDAGRAGVLVHGCAGDEAAWLGSQAGMTAGDVLGRIPHVLRQITGR